jgi:hypothetical protein
MQLKLAVPRQVTKGSVTIETRPKQVKAWLDLLPMGNLVEAAESLCDALGELNRSVLDEDTRIKVLELYRPIIQTLAPALQEQYTGSHLPLPDKSRQMAGLVREMLVELGYGYKIALLGLARKRFGGKTQIPLLIQRALASLLQVLLASYQSYAPVPPGTWREINILFHLALEQKCQEDPIPDGDQTLSCANLFKQALLFSLANPYHLMPGEAVKVKDYLERFAYQAQLLPLASTTSQAGIFLVRLEGDTPPKAITKHTSLTDARTDILLNSLELARGLHQQIARLEARTPPRLIGLPDGALDPQYPDLLKRLLKYWGIAPKRVFSRTQKQDAMEVCVGLRALHTMLNNGQPYRMPVAPGADATETAPARPQQAFAVTAWKLLNESAGGVSLAKDLATEVQVRVGELIGIRPKTGLPWNLSVVRWVSSDHANHLELGAQMLAPDALPGALRPTIAAETAAYLPVLLVPEIPALKQASSLIAPRGQYSEMREYYLERGGQVRTIRATRIMEQTSSYERFEYKASAG